MKQPAHWHYYILLALAPLTWAGNSIAGEMLEKAIDPFALGLMRWLLVSLMLAPFMISEVKSKWDQIWQHKWHLILLGALSASVSGAFLYLALKYTSMINVGLIYAMVPIFILLLSYVFLGETLNGLKTIAVVLSTFGLIYIMCGGHLFSIKEITFHYGDLWALLSAISWSSFSVGLKRLPKFLSPLCFLFITATVGWIVLLPVAGIEYSLLQHHIEWSVHLWAWLMYAALIASIMGYSFWNIGLVGIGPAKAGLFFNLLPIYSAILAVTVLNEQLHVYHLIGAIFVIAGLLLGNFRRH